MTTTYIITRSDELYHEGVKGMHWGERRWQYKNGSLTPEGRKHYGVGEPRSGKHDDREWRKFEKLVNKTNRRGVSDRARQKLMKSKKMQELMDDDDLRKKRDDYKKAHDEWYKLTKGEDYDAFNPDKNGYDTEYGITKEHFNKAVELDTRRRRAQDALSTAVRQRVDRFVGDRFDQTVPDAKQSSNQLYKTAKAWIEIQAYKELNKG